MNGNKNKNCLFICTVSPLNTKIKSGGVSLTRANLMTLESMYSVTIVDTLLQYENSFAKKLSLFARLMLSFFNYLAGNSPLIQRRVQKLLRSKKFDLVFIDHSQLGGLAKVVKKTSPQTKIFLAFQNIEYDYFGQSLHLPFGLTKLIKNAAFYNEQIGLKIADNVIALTEEDSNRLNELYNRKADIIIPITVAEPNATDSEVNTPVKTPYILFCGSYFEPNKNGILWFIEYVLPFIKFNLVVIGYQMENLLKSKEFLALSKKVSTDKIQILGTVSDVAPYYQHTTLVINPVNEGAGMNTKSVEAMAYGKRLITTEFAIRGFPRPLPNTIEISKTSEDFIDLINNSFEQPKITEGSNKFYFEESYDYFKKHFSLSNRIQEIFKYLDL